MALQEDEQRTGETPLDEIIVSEHFHDAGNLTLAFVMLWAYFAFSQYLIIWAGNLPKEIAWYQHRLQTSWRVVGILLVVFHFAVPFLVLLSRDVKRKMERLATVAVGMILIRFVDLFWVVRPSFGGGPSIHWMDLAAPIGIGGLWVAVFLWQLSVRPLMPVHNPQGDPSF